ncbi:MAG: type II secretion system protein N [Burkholderiales bacterium]
MRILGIVILVLGLVVGAVTLFAPASLADRALESNSNGRLRLADTNGTLWSGGGTLTDATNSWRVPLRWSVPPRSLMSSMHELVLEPVPGAAMPTGVVGIGKDSASLRDFAVEIPAQALAGMLGARGAVTLGGTLALRTPSLDWNGNQASGSLNAQWSDARLAVGNAVANLGAVDVALAPAGDRLAGPLRNSGGDVRIDGNVSVAGRTVDVSANVAPAAGAPPHIALALAALGPPDAAGNVRVAWRGLLR